MLLSIVGACVIICVIVLFITRKVPVLFVLTVPAIIGAFICGFSATQIGEFAASGISSIAATGIMLTFAMIFFSTLNMAGMFDPILKFIIRTAKSDPLKIAIATVLISIATHLDGSGNTTFLITCSALYPIYMAVGMSPMILVILCGLTAGVMNHVPWGGSLARAASALSIDAQELWQPMIWWIVFGLITMFIMAVIFGLRARKALDYKEKKDFVHEHVLTESESELRRPKMLFPNLILCLATIVCLMFSKLPVQAVFIVASAIALLINYPQPDLQRKVIKEMAPDILFTAAIIFAAGVFSGILSGSGMVAAIAETIVGWVPAMGGTGLVIVTALLSPLFLLFLDANGIYFGLLPVLASAATAAGASASAMAYAVLCGQHLFCCVPMSGSAWILASSCHYEMGEIQKKVYPIAWILTILFLVVGLIFGFMS